jgi:hypothetical protein
VHPAGLVIEESNMMPEILLLIFLVLMLIFAMWLLAVRL